MRTIAIEASSLTASVALSEDGVLIGEFTTNLKKTHSQTLLPMLDDLLKMLELPADWAQFIAVCAGPGSFTGLRIAAATAKGLAQATGARIIPVPTVDALAFNMWGCADVVCPIMDARREQVYTGLYDFVGREHGFDVLLPQCAIAFEEVAGRINDLGRPVVFLGDGVEHFRPAMDELLTVGYTIAPPTHRYQRAACVSALAEQMYIMNPEVAVDAASFAPDYLRQSQAERERAQKEGKE